MDILVVLPPGSPRAPGKGESALCVQHEGSQMGDNEAEIPRTIDSFRSIAKPSKPFLRSSSFYKNSWLAAGITG